MITNLKGETIYAYWKIIYEELTEEFLYDTYELRNVKLLQGEVKKTPMAITSFTPMVSNPLLTQFNVNAEIFQEQPVKQAGSQWRKIYCFDEMDIADTSFRKTMMKAKKKSGVGDSSEKSNIFAEVKRSLFAPVAVCIKTKNMYNEQAESLLEALISVLYRNEGSYINDLHNMIYSFAEFSSHIMALTKIICPPPLSELSISLGDKNISYYEGLIGGFPGEMDCAVAQLFSLVKVDFVILLWTAILLEQRIIIYTPDANMYFFIVKALSQLIFPFTWAFSKGIAPNLDLLTTPFPFCFGKLLP